MKHFVSLITFVCLAACSTKVITEYSDVVALQASCLYRNDSVIAYLTRYGNTNKDLAASYFAKAEKEEDTNPEKAVYYFKRAASLHPLKETYLRLALLLEQLERKEELNTLYGLLVYPASRRKADNSYEEFYVFGQPDEDLFYESLVATIRAYNYLPSEVLFGAEEKGINRQRIRERMKAEKRLQLDTASLAYKEIMLQFVHYDSLRTYAYKADVFSSFVKSLQDSAHTFEISAENAARFDYDKYRSEMEYFGPQLMLSGVTYYYLKEKQDKENAWLKFTFNRALYFGNIRAMVYAIDTSVNGSPRAMRHIYHRLVTYNDTGGVIDSKVIAWQAGNSLGTCKVNGRQIYITDYLRSWKNPYKYDEFDNYLVDQRKNGESAYTVDENGRITPL